jgi:hypothetical protein
VGNRNIYNRGDNNRRNASPELANRSRQEVTRRADRTAPGRNDVLSDRDGNVYRRNGDGSWDSREGREWRPTQAEGRAARPEARPEARPQTRPEARPQNTRPATRSAPTGVQRDYSSRVRGASRAGASPRTRGGR